MTFVFSGSDGFNLGCFVWTWRLFGPLMFYREMLSTSGAGEPPDPSVPPLSGWQVALFFSRRGLAEFYEGVCK